MSKRAKLSGIGKITHAHVSKNIKARASEDTQGRASKNIKARASWNTKARENRNAPARPSAVREFTATMLAGMNIFAAHLFSGMNKFTRRMLPAARKFAAALLSAATVLTTQPAVTYADTAAKIAAADEPYIVSAGRMTCSSSDYGNNTSDNAVDGNDTTRWESAHATIEPQWFYVDLGKVTQITSVRILWEGAYAKSYKIQFSSDEEVWTDEYTDDACEGGDETLPVSGNARYVRIYMTVRAQEQYGYSFYAFDVYGLNGLTPRPDAFGENLAKGQKVESSGLRDVWWMYHDGVIDQTQVLAENAVDGKNDTSWTSAEADDQWLYVDLGTPADIGRVIIRWTEDAAKIRDIQVSDNASEWTTLWRGADGSPDWVDNVPLYAAGVKYVRIYCHNRVSNGSGFGIRELEVYPYIDGEDKTTYTLEELPQTTVVKKGDGSYITTDLHRETAKTPKYIDTDNIQAPIDSNDWYQSAMIKKFGNPMSTLPFKTGYSKKGLSVITATDGWLPEPGETDVNLSVVTETTPDLYILPENIDAASAYDRVHDYSDYSAALQLCDQNGVAMTSVHVKGCPYIFCTITDRQSVYVTVPNLTAFFGDDGATLLSSGEETVADHIGVHVTDSDNKAREKTAQSYYCLTFPENTKLKNAGGRLKITMPEGTGYFSVSSMRQKSDLSTYYRHGYAFVTDTSVTYSYDKDSAKITSDYTANTSLMREGFEADTMQCLLPHQWKKSVADDAGYTGYPSVRGSMRGVWSNHFTTEDTFGGLLPTFALPSDSGFDSEVALQYLGALDDATSSLNPAADAYWEGKNLHPLGMGALMADQLGETELRDEFLGRIRTILVNWFTYDGDDDVSYFIYDEHWGTLYYAQSEFGANWGICDHHFTYGYFMFAATVLSTYDSDFYTRYKDMIDLLVRDYANPDGQDDEYCRFRAYDLYEGHSWAGGYADNDSGNNQESASESLFSWVGLYLWGVLSGNDSYRDAGIFGFTNEMEAVKQYWFNYDKDNWVADWPYEVVAQVYGSINFYGTFFGGQPLYCYGIQWLPVSEYLTYYGTDTQRAGEIYQGLLNDTEDAMGKAEIAARNEGKTQDEIDKLLNEYPQADTGWQHITWPFLSLSDPDLALSKTDSLMDKVQKTDQANTYWFIHSMKQLGTRSADIVATGDLPASVYYNAGIGTYTADVWNPSDTSKTVTFKDAGGKTLGTALAGAKSLVRFDIDPENAFDYEQTATPTFTATGLTDGVKKENISGKQSFADTQILTISCADSDAEIYYTLDGSVPDEKSALYEEPVLVSDNVTVKAVAVKEGAPASAFSSVTFEIAGDQVSGQDNIAGGRTAHVSSLQGDNPEYAAENLTDGSEETRWSSASGNDDEYCYVDLGRECAVNKVRLVWETACAREYEIQVSGDEKEWRTVASVSDGKAGERIITFDAVKARYVRVQGISRATEYGYSIYEFEVYEALKAAAPDISPSGGAFDSPQTVTMTTSVKGAEIKYTTDGSEPGAGSPSYTAPLTVQKSSFIKAVTYRKGMLLSDETDASLIIRGTVALSSEDLTLAEGNTKTLSALTDETVTWNSDRTDIATVASDGTVTAVAEGDAVITASTSHDTATCKVHVVPAVKLLSISLSSETLDLTIRSSAELTVIYNPADTTDDRTVVWESSRPDIASVDEGVVLAKAEGEADITARCGEFTAVCHVTVSPKYTVEEKLTNEEYNLFLKHGTFLQSGCFEGSLDNLHDGAGFGGQAGGNWASQTVNATSGDAFLIVNLDRNVTLSQLDALYIQWKNNLQTLPTDGFKVLVADDEAYDVTEGMGQMQSGNQPDIPIVTADNTAWATVFDSASDQAVNATGEYDWEENETGALSVLRLANESYTKPFNHIKIAFDYAGEQKPWGIQAYETGLLLTDEAAGEEPTVPGETESETSTEKLPETESETESVTAEETESETVSESAGETVTEEESESESATAGESESESATAPESADSRASVSVNGYQISTTIGGYRTLYSVSDPDGDAVSAGLIYSPASGVTDADLVKDSANERVKTFTATEKGLLDVTFNDEPDTRTYAMTLTFMDKPTATFFNAGWYVRAFIQLEDGSVRYSDVCEFSIFKVADYLYQNHCMNNESAHRYLYDTILSVAKSGYPPVDFDWDNSFVPPDEWLPARRYGEF